MRDDILQRSFGADAGDSAMSPFNFSIQPAEVVWRRFELQLSGPTGGNPYLEVEVSARFAQDDRVVEVPGFYDGDGTYRVRFLPDAEGTWTWTSVCAKVRGAMASSVAA